MIVKKKRTRLVIVAVIGVVLLATVFSYASPKLRASLFVHAYHDLIEEGLTAGNGVPADDAVLFGYKYVNSWDAEHPMTEFLIMTWGDTYYGCYYSPDGVPLAFQNTDVPLAQDGHDYWEWTDEGDNHGSTSKIMEHWYYFSASF